MKDRSQGLTPAEGFLENSPGRDSLSLDTIADSISIRARRRAGQTSGSLDDLRIAQSNYSRARRRFPGTEVDRDKRRFMVVAAVNC